MGNQKLRIHSSFEINFIQDNSGYFRLDPDQEETLQQMSCLNTKAPLNV